MRIASRRALRISLWLIFAHVLLAARFSKPGISSPSSPAQRPWRPWSDFKEAVEVDGIQVKTGYFEKAFTVLRRIGKGGFGTVDVVKQGNETFAIKAVRLGKVMKDYDFNEARVLSELNDHTKAEHIPSHIISLKSSWLEIVVKSNPVSAVWDTLTVPNEKTERVSYSYSRTASDNAFEFAPRASDAISNDTSVHSFRPRFEDHARPGISYDRPSHERASPEPASPAVSETEATLYLQMEYCDGGDLWKVMNHENRSMLEVVQILEDAVKALAYVHERGYLHKDLKPANILATHIGGELHGVLTDFGFAMHIGNDHSFHAGSTPGYACPPKLDSTPACDIYSLGMTIAAVFCPSGTLMQRGERFRWLHGVAKSLMEQHKDAGDFDEFDPVGEEMQRTCPHATALAIEMLSSRKSLDGLLTTALWRSARAEAVARDFQVEYQKAHPEDNHVSRRAGSRVRKNKRNRVSLIPVSYTVRGRGSAEHV